MPTTDREDASVTSKSGPAWREVAIRHAPELPARARSAIPFQTPYQTLGDLYDALQTGEFTQARAMLVENLGKKTWTALIEWYSAIPAPQDQKPTSVRRAPPRKNSAATSAKPNALPLGIETLRANRERMKHNSRLAQARAEAQLEAAHAEQARQAALQQKEERAAQRRRQAAEQRNREADAFLAQVRQNLQQAIEYNTSRRAEIESLSLLCWPTLAVVLFIGAVVAGGIAVNNVPHRGDISDNIITLGTMICLFVLWIWFMEIVSPILHQKSEIAKCDQEITTANRRIFLLGNGGYGLDWRPPTRLYRARWQIIWYDNPSTPNSDQPERAITP